MLKKNKEKSTKNPSRPTCVELRPSVLAISGIVMTCRLKSYAAIRPPGGREHHQVGEIASSDIFASWVLTDNFTEIG